MLGKLRKVSLSDFLHLLKHFCPKLHSCHFSPKFNTLSVLVYCTEVDFLCSTVINYDSRAVKLADFTVRTMLSYWCRYDRATTYFAKDLTKDQQPLHISRYIQYLQPLQQPHCLQQLQHQLQQLQQLSQSQHQLQLHQYQLQRLQELQQLYPLIKPLWS